MSVPSRPLQQQCSEVDLLVGGVSFGRRVSVVLEDFANVFGGEGVFLDLGLAGWGGGCDGEAFLVGVAFGLEAGPAFDLFFQGGWLWWP